jgi:hypothetical protein
MGLDIALGILVLLAGLRGWLKGFVRQAIGLGALVGCVYLADPVRDQARPYVRSYFPSIQPDHFDKLLWWVCAVVCYVASSGLAIWVVKLAKRKAYGDPEPNRGDQGAGFLLGAVKGLVVASFLAAGIVKYEPMYTRFAGGTWVEEQVEASQGLGWAQQYRPAERLWHSQPVQAFIAHIRSQGTWESSPHSSADPPPIRTADSRPRTLDLPPPPPLDPRSPTFLNDVDQRLGSQETTRKSR